MRRCIHTASLGILLSYSVAFGMGEIKDVTKTFGQGGPQDDGRISLWPMWEENLIRPGRIAQIAGPTPVRDTWLT